MPLFNESIESIAQAIVTVKRALEHGVIEKEDYKGLNDYLNKQKTVHKIKKSHLTRANRDLDDELQAEVEEFFMDEDEALCKMAEDLLEEHEGEVSDLPYNWGIVKETAEDKHSAAEDKQSAACKAWLNMDDKEREEIAALASAWQKSR